MTLSPQCKPRRKRWCKSSPHTKMQIKFSHFLEFLNNVKVSIQPLCWRTMNLNFNFRQKPQALPFTTNCNSDLIAMPTSFRESTSLFLVGPCSSGCWNGRCLFLVNLEFLQQPQVTASCQEEVMLLYFVLPQVLCLLYNSANLCLKEIAIKEMMTMDAKQN